eukprot:11213577-Lingulodinium_polyedra.AAC.1
MPRAAPCCVFVAGLPAACCSRRVAFVVFGARRWRVSSLPLFLGSRVAVGVVLRVAAAGCPRGVFRRRRRRSRHRRRR